MPAPFQYFCGRQARVVVSLPDSAPLQATDANQQASPIAEGIGPHHARKIDLMAYSNTVSWPVDGLAYQKDVRKEWESGRYLTPMR